MKKLLLVDNASDNLTGLQSLATAAGYAVTTVSHDMSRIKLTGWAAIVLSGGFLHVNAAHYISAYRDEMELIRLSNVPVVGICLGMHLIVEAYSGQIRRLELEQGWRDIQLTATGQKLLGLPRRVKVYENHTRMVRSLTDELESLARSPTGIEIIRHRSRPLVGVQFHPEVQLPSLDGIALFRHLISIAGANIEQTGAVAEPV